MQQHAKRSERDGVTLIEVLVMLLLVALLAAAVFPVVSQRVNRDEPVKASRHLSAIRMGIEAFNQDLQGTYPAEMKQLLTPITVMQRGLREAGRISSFDSIDVNRWTGPYVDPAALDGGRMRTAYGVPLRMDFTPFDATHDSPLGSAGFSWSGSSLFVAVQLGTAGTQLSTPQFEAINDLVDGQREPDGPGSGRSWTMGRLRFGNMLSPADTIAYYLAVPLE